MSRNVSGAEVRRAIENNPPVAGGGGGGAGVGGEGIGDEEAAEFPDLEAIFQKFRFDEGFVPEEEEREDWIEDERRFGLLGENDDDEEANDDDLVDDGDGSVSALPAPERPEPVRPRATSPAAIREGLGAPEPAVTALQSALSDAVEDAQTFDEEIGEEEGKEDKFWADQPVEEMKLWTM